jgi:tight adherence protein C
MALRRLGFELAARRPLERAAPRDLRARLIAAGEPAGLSVRDWVALKAACAFVALPLFGLLFAGAPGRILMLVLVAAPVGGFFAPDVWLARLCRQRGEAASRELPDMLDLLRVTVEAGMPPVRGIGVVAAEFDGTLAAEWRRVVAAVAFGASQDEALAGLRERLPADAITALVEALRRALRHGAPLGRTLALQAARARERRHSEIRERAARAGPKIQLVVALLLVPAVLLIVAAGLVAELKGSGLFVPV